MNNEISKYCNENDVEVYTVFAYTENYNHAHGTFLNRKAAEKCKEEAAALYKRLDTKAYISILITKLHG